MRMVVDTRMPHSRLEFVDRYVIPLDAYLLPVERDRLLAGSRERAESETSLRLFKHTLFDFCPVLKEQLGKNEQAVFDEFASYWFQGSPRVPELVHGYLLQWLFKNHQEYINDETEFELLVRTAIRWVQKDRTALKGIFVCSSIRGGKAVSVLKPIKIDELLDITKLILEEEFERAEIVYQKYDDENDIELIKCAPLLFE